MNGYIEDGPDHVAELMQHEFLYNLLEAASVDLDKCDEEASSSCIKGLFPNLTYDRALWPVVENGFGDFFKKGHSLEKSLKKTRSNFQSTWKTFESLRTNAEPASQFVLEQKDVTAECQNKPWPG